REPPAFSRYPTDDAREGPAFCAEDDRVPGAQIAGFDAWLQDNGGPRVPSGRDYMYESPFLNLYLFPEATDYRRATQLPPTWHRLDSSVRTDEPFDVQAALPGDAPIIYLSLGSLGSADVELMQRLIDVLGKTDYRVIV